MTEVALVARAHGLRSRLLAREALDRLADAADPAALARALAALPVMVQPVPGPRAVFAIEHAAGSAAGRLLRTLYAWQERWPGPLDVFIAQQDRRSLRAMLRGAVQGASAETRLDGLVATPSLPLALLSELARQPSVRDVVRLIVVAAHPDASRLAPLARGAQPDLLRLDHALLQGFAERTTRAARNADATLGAYAAAVIDICNAQHALLLAGEPRDIPPAGVFVAGGSALPLDAFTAAARADSPGVAWTRLSTRLARSPFGAGLPVAAVDAAHLDRSFLISALARLARLARLEPLGTAPVLRVLLLIEAQCRDLRTLAWGAALGVPPSLRRAQLVTPS